MIFFYSFTENEELENEEISTNFIIKLYVLLSFRE